MKWDNVSGTQQIRRRGGHAGQQPYLWFWESARLHGLKQASNISDSLGLDRRGVGV
jgi:hypothetical protein